MDRDLFRGRELDFLIDLTIDTAFSHLAVSCGPWITGFVDGRFARATLAAEFLCVEVCSACGMTVGRSGATWRKVHDARATFNPELCALLLRVATKVSRAKQPCLLKLSNFVSTRQP